MTATAFIPEGCSVAIVGGGTAGLSLATRLAKLGITGVVVLEREAAAGGIPRHCGHYPFGLREYKRLLKGPDYAQRNVEAALKAGVRIATGVTVTGLHPQGRLSLTTPEGKAELKARRVVLCTGVRESSRAQRLVGGARPLGVISTGALQDMVYLRGQRPFRQPVILGTELVSFSAIMTCQHVGVRPVAMIEENNRITARQIFRPYPVIKGVPVVSGISELRIAGARQVEAVTFLDAGGNRQTIKTDGVIVSGKFRPEAALLRGGHLRVDPQSGGPLVDQDGRCSDPSYFCTGNLLRPVETSSWCWHEAAKTAETVARDLAVEVPAAPRSVSIIAVHPAIKFVLPQCLSVLTGSPMMKDLQLRLNRRVDGALIARSNGKTLFRQRLKSLPERRILAPLEPLIANGFSSLIEIDIEETP